MSQDSKAFKVREPQCPLSGTGEVPRRGCLAEYRKVYVTGYVVKQKNHKKWSNIGHCEARQNLLRWWQWDAEALFTMAATSRAATQHLQCGRSNWATGLFISIHFNWNNHMWPVQYNSLYTQSFFDENATKTEMVEPRKVFLRFWEMDYLTYPREQGDLSLPSHRCLRTRLPQLQMSVTITLLPNAEAELQIN